MGIALEKAHELARSKRELPAEWLDRVDRIGRAPSKTYVAAFGGALLAKATDRRVDSLSHKAGAGPTSYSIRGPAEFMASQAQSYGYHLGVTGRNPLNNAPFNRGPDR